MITRRKLATVLASAFGAVGLGRTASAREAIDAKMMRDFPEFLYARNAAMPAMTYADYRPQIYIKMDTTTGNLLITGGEPGGVELGYALTTQFMKIGSLEEIATTYEKLRASLWHATHCEDGVACAMCKDMGLHGPTEHGQRFDNLPSGTRLEMMTKPPQGWRVVERRAAEGIWVCEKV